MKRKIHNLSLRPRKDERWKSVGDQEKYSLKYRSAKRFWESGHLLFRLHSVTNVFICLSYRLEMFRKASYRNQRFGEFLQLCSALHLRVWHLVWSLVFILTMNVKRRVPARCLRLRFECESLTLDAAFSFYLSWGKISASTFFIFWLESFTQWRRRRKQVLFKNGQRRSCLRWMQSGNQRCGHESQREILLRNYLLQMCHLQCQSARNSSLRQGGFTLLWRAL